MRSMKKNKIHIIATGGTIDSKFYAPTESSLVKQESGIPSFLDMIIKPHFYFSFDQHIMVDSNDITNQVRDSLIEKIKNSPSDKILITHGTNTLTQTLHYFTEKLTNTPKTIFLTGSMIPMDGFCPTDGGFNLGFAIANLINYPAGVYIAMNGAVFADGDVKKNFDIARFEYIKS